MSEDHAVSEVSRGNLFPAFLLGLVLLAIVLLAIVGIPCLVEVPLYTHRPSSHGILHVFTLSVKYPSVYAYLYVSFSVLIRIPAILD